MTGLVTLGLVLGKCLEAGKMYMLSMFPSIKVSWTALHLTKLRLNVSMLV